MTGSKASAAGITDLPGSARRSLRWRGGTLRPASRWPAVGRCGSTRSSGARPAPGSPPRPSQPPEAGGSRYAAAGDRSVGRSQRVHGRRQRSRPTRLPTAADPAGGLSTPQTPCRCRYPEAIQYPIGRQCREEPGRDRHDPLMPALAIGKGGASPDDPDLAEYWAQRRRKVKPPLDAYTVRLLTKQNGRCTLVRGEPDRPRPATPVP